MSIHFLSNHPIDFFKLGGGVNTTPAAPWDTDYVKQTLTCVSTAAPDWRQEIICPTKDDFYWQARCVLGGPASTGIGLVKFYSGPAGALVERYQIQYPNFGSARLMGKVAGVWTQIGGNLALNPFSLYALTVQFKHDAVDGKIEFSVNNAIVGTFLGDTTSYNPDGEITYVELFNPSAGSGAFAVHQFAEFVVTTGENPYLVRVKTHVLQANSAVNADWVGDYTYVDEADPSAADVISSSNDGDISTFTVDPLPALGALIVRAVQVTAMARCGVGGPQNLEPVLRASGVEQNVGGPQALTTGFNPKRTVLQINSVTGVEFTKAEIDASEPGVKAVA